MSDVGKTVRLAPALLVIAVGCASNPSILWMDDAGAAFDASGEDASGEDASGEDASGEDANIAGDADDAARDARVSADAGSDAGVDGSMPRCPCESLCVEREADEPAHAVEHIVGLGPNEAWYIRNWRVYRFLDGVETEIPVPTPWSPPINGLMRLVGGPAGLWLSSGIGVEDDERVHERRHGLLEWNGAGWTERPVPPLPPTTTRVREHYRRFDVVAQGETLYGAFTTRADLWVLRDGAWQVDRVFEGRTIVFIDASESTLVVTLADANNQPPYTYAARFGANAWQILDVPEHAEFQARAAGTHVAIRGRLIGPEGNHAVPAMRNLVAAGEYRGVPHVLTESALFAFDELDAPTVHSHSFGSQSLGRAFGGSLSESSAPWMGSESLYSWNGSSWAVRVPRPVPAFIRPALVAGTPDDLWVFSNIARGNALHHVRGGVAEHFPWGFQHGLISANSPLLMTTAGNLWMMGPHGTGEALAFGLHAFQAGQRVEFIPLPEFPAPFVAGRGQVDDTVWVASNSDVLRLEGNELVADVTLPARITDLVVDGHGEPWALAGRTLHHRTGGTWSELMIPVPGTGRPLSESETWGTGGALYAGDTRVWVVVGSAIEERAFILEWDNSGWNSSYEVPTSFFIFAGRGDDVELHVGTRGSSLSLHERWRRRGPGMWERFTCENAPAVSTVWWPEDEPAPRYLGRNGLIVRSVTE